MVKMEDLGQVVSAPDSPANPFATSHRASNLMQSSGVTRHRSCRWSPTGWARWSVPGWGVGAADSRAKRSTDRRGGHGPRHIGRPRSPDVLGLSLAAGVPGRLRRPAGLVHQAPCGGQPPTGRSHPGRSGPSGAGGSGRDPRCDRLDRPGWRRAGLRVGAVSGAPRHIRPESNSRAGTRAEHGSSSHRSLAGKTIPILLAVTDRGHPKLTRYGRVLIADPMKE